MYAIETFKLRKEFIEKNQRLCAVNDVELRIKQQEIVALTGENGAGKTTLIKLLSCLIYPTGGTAQVAGYDILRQEYSVRSLVGLVPGDERSFYWRLTGRQNLEFFASLYGVSRQEASSRIGFLSSLLNLENELNRRFLSYSAGARQKLAIIRALIHKPRVLLMDEPFKNLDQATIKAVQQYIRSGMVSACGSTVLYATHSLLEVNGFSTMLIEMRKGAVKEC